MKRSNANAIDCNGLSPAPTVLRIKQALIGRARDSRPLDILLDPACDTSSLARSLGKLADRVRLVAHPA